MKRICAHLALAAVMMLPIQAMAQGMHYSQYYNAPMLLSPANTGLMPDNDYRLGVNYRTQWATVPVPYHTFSAYGDAITAMNEEGTSWLGLGAAFFSDKAGDGNLALNRFEVCAAYHLGMGEYTMLSIGGSAATVQRSVDFSRLTFDTQWDGTTFSQNMVNGELPGVKKTNYFDVSAGLNLAWFPNENAYMKLGVAASHLNTPTESFYGQNTNLGIRPTGNVDGLFFLGSQVILNPSVYYTYQKGASELLYGSLFSTVVGGRRNKTALVLGAYNRWNESIIPVLGFEYSTLRIMSSYDITISQLAPYNNRSGAFEIALIWKGKFSRNSGTDRKVLSCPRFF